VTSIVKYVRMTRICRVAPLSLVLLVAVFAITNSAILPAQTAKENAADAARLVRLLEVHSGITIGEIGAGSGELTIALAREVGEQGRVYSNELNEKSLQEIAANVGKAGLRNVTFVAGRPASANLPDACCDAIFMRNVYHHFADPATMDASLFQSLKPGGRLAVIDFAPDGEESPDAPGRSTEGHHGVGSATVARELTHAGFEVVTTEPIRDKGFIVVARRPS